jgi:predicted nucleic acid-binding protein
MKLRVYTDTSVFSAYFDDRAVDRKSLTREFWQNLGAYECATSELAVEELRQTADLQLRTQMESLLVGFQIIPVTDEMRTLAENICSRARSRGRCITTLFMWRRPRCPGRMCWYRGISNIW